MPTVNVMPGMGEAAYRPLQAMNATALRCLSTLTPRHWSHKLAHPERTPAMALGSALHAAVLEPLAFLDSYAVAPDCDRRTTAGKAAWAKFCADNAGKEPIKEEDFVTIMGMKNGLLGHAECAMWLQLCQSREVVLLGELDGIPAKAKIDAVSLAQGYFCDIKSIGKAATMDTCQYAAQDSGYFLQCAFYRRMLVAAGVEFNGCALLFVEKDAPWCARALPVSIATLDLADHALDAAIANYQRWMANPVEGWVDGDTELSMKPWAARALAGKVSQ